MFNRPLAHTHWEWMGSKGSLIDFSSGLYLYQLCLSRFCCRRFLLPEYLPYAGIFHERGQPGLATHSSVNRVLAGKHSSCQTNGGNVQIWSWADPVVFSGASIGDGQSAVASNIANTTYRLQWWDFTKFDLPEVSNGTMPLTWVWSPGWVQWVLNSINDVRDVDEEGLILLCVLMHVMHWPYITILHTNYLTSAKSCDSHVIFISHIWLFEGEAVVPGLC